jgi:lysophospholipase L1-like esterase
MIAMAEEPHPYHFDPAVLKPFWRTDTMYGETVLFLKATPNAAPKATVYFEPTEILSVNSTSGTVTYQEGQDYVWKPGSHEITLPQGSKIPFKTPQDLCRPAKSQQFQLTRGDGTEVLFGGGHEYQDMQTAVTYKHRMDEWTESSPSFSGSQLPRTLAKLKNREPVSLVLLGDSISTGCNASGWAKVAPFQPPYQDLLVMNLEATYGGKVHLTNLAVGGTGSEWGLSQVGKVIEAKPDLVMLAFGMNDAHGVPTDKYQANIKGMIDGVRKGQPDAEFILIAPMLGNFDWVSLRREAFPQYRDSLEKLCGPGVVLADMTSIWTELLKVKKDCDMTGNGVNHPNDFGHRIYAQVLSTLLIGDMK